MSHPLLLDVDSSKKSLSTSQKPQTMAKSQPQTDAGGRFKAECVGDMHVAYNASGAQRNAWVSANSTSALGTAIVQSQFFLSCGSELLQVPYFEQSTKDNPEPHPVALWTRRHEIWRQHSGNLRDSSDYAGNLQTQSGLATQARSKKQINNFHVDNSVLFYTDVSRIFFYWIDDH